MTCGAGSIKSARSTSAARERERTAVQDVKRREQSGPLGGGWPNASAGRSHQVSFEYNPEAS